MTLSRKFGRINTTCDLQKPAWNVQKRYIQAIHLLQERNIFPFSPFFSLVFSLLSFVILHNCIYNAAVLIWEYSLPQMKKNIWRLVTSQKKIYWDSHKDCIVTLQSDSSSASPLHICVHETMSQDLRWKSERNDELTARPIPDSENEKAIYMDTSKGVRKK